MQFMVIVRASEPARAVVSADDELEAAVETMHRLNTGADPRIVAVYSFAGERAFAMVVEVDSGRELEDVVFALPIERLVTFEVHALGEPV